MASENVPWNAATGVGAEFQPTAWTDLRALSLTADPLEQRAALERICRSYWKPIYAFIRRRGHTPEAAQDLTQDFFQHLLSKERLKLADQKRGRFRSFIQRSLSNFLASDWDRRSAQKRDERVVVSLDETFDDGCLRFEPVAGEAPDRAFDRAWAVNLLTTVRARLEAELRHAGKESSLRLLPLAVREDDTTRYATIAVELGLSESAVKKAIERLRIRWEQLLRAEVAATVQTADEVEAELRDLLAVLAQ